MVQPPDSSLNTTSCASTPIQHCSSVLWQTQWHLNGQRVHFSWAGCGVKKQAAMIFHFWKNGEKQRIFGKAFSLPPIRIWARRTAQIWSSGIFIEIPAVFFYFWNETAGAETAGLSPAAAPGPVSRCLGHASTSWVCAPAVKNAQTAAFCMPNSVFCRHISAVFGVRRRRPPAGGRACCPTSGLFQGGRPAEGAPVA